MINGKEIMYKKTLFLFFLSSIRKIIDEITKTPIITGIILRPSVVCESKSPILLEIAIIGG